MLEVPRGPQRQHCSPHLLNPPELLREPVDGTRGLESTSAASSSAEFCRILARHSAPFIIGERAGDGGGSRLGEDAGALKVDELGECLPTDEHSTLPGHFPLEGHDRITARR